MKTTRDILVNPKTPVNRTKKRKKKNYKPGKYIRTNQKYNFALGATARPRRYMFSRGFATPR